MSKDPAEGHSDDCGWRLYGCESNCDCPAGEKKVSDLVKFKEDYPDVYEKFLEMNRAIAKLTRVCDDLNGRRKLQHREAELPASDLPTVLEWE